MKKLVMTALAVGALALNAPIVAHASGDNYKGGCGFETLNDTTPGGQLGGQDQWTGDVYVAVASTNPPGAAVTVDCILKVDGVDNGVVLSASGTGVAANTKTISFTAGEASIVELCDAVTIDGVAQPVDCGTATTTPIVPPVVVEAINTVIDLLNNEVLSKIDPTICPILASAAPGVGPIIINGEGDVWIGSTADTDKFWDCPPYDPPTV